jgi:hypothetical protein
VPPARYFKKCRLSLKGLKEAWGAFKGVIVLRAETALVMKALRLVEAAIKCNSYTANATDVTWLSLTTALSTLVR